MEAVFPQTPLRAKEIKTDTAKRKTTSAENIRPMAIRETRLVLKVLGRERMIFSTRVCQSDMPEEGL